MKKDWFKNFLTLTGGIPSSFTYKRVFSIIKPDELENICVLFAQDVLKLFNSKKQENEVRDYEYFQTEDISSYYDLKK